MTSDDAIVSVSLPLCEGGVNNEAFLGGNLLEIWARLPVTTLTGGTEELGDLTGGTEELGDLTGGTKKLGDLTGGTEELGDLTGGTEELGDLTGGTEELGDGLLVRGMIMYGTTAGKNCSK